MRLAWFRPAPLAHATPTDATAPLLAELAATHDVDIYTQANAHEFVWTHGRAPYALHAFELDNTLAHAFIWPYLLHYGGLLLLTSPSLHDSRARALVRAGRRQDYAAEFLFSEGQPPRAMRADSPAPEGGWPMLRVPLAAAHVTVVPYCGLAKALRDQYPQARIVHAPLAVQQVTAPRDRHAAGSDGIVFGILADDRIDVARRALARARGLGAHATLTAASAEQALRESDVILALSWPSGGESTPLARAALASGVPVVALETILTADWPALDPQTWRPRGYSTDRPIAVTVDLRDEEHSLALAMRRLAADARLRSALGEAARAWSRVHESVPVAVSAWERLLHDAATVDPLPRPADWPPHLDADGTERARAMLAEFGVGVDVLQARISQG